MCNCQRWSFTQPQVFDLHFQLVRNHKCNVIYKVPNLFALPVPKFIYFFADSCHLIKTARNCLYNSGSGSNSCLMWNNGSYLMFRHIADLFYSDQELALHTHIVRSHRSYFTQQNEGMFVNVILF